MAADRGRGGVRAGKESIFERCRTSREGGTGLGLAIARDAIRAQDGTITVNDAPGGGARFEIRLPAGGDA